MNYILSIFSIIIGFSLFFTNLSYADSYSDCGGSIAKDIISGCTNLIKTGKLSKENLAGVYNRRAGAFIELENFELAISDLSKLIELSQKNTEAKMHLAIAYALRGDKYLGKNELDKAIADYKTAYLMQPYEVSFKKLLVRLFDLRGDKYLLKKEHRKAIGEYSEAIAFGENNAELYTSRAEAYAQANDTDNAIADFSKAIQLKPVLTEARKRRGDLYLSMGAYINAIVDFDEVIKKEPNNIQFFLLRASAHALNGAMSEATVDFKKVLKINRRNKEAKEGLKRLQKDTSQIAKLLQIELKIAKCYRGRIDGKWGSGSTAAMRHFANLAGFSSEFKSASQKNLKLVSEAHGVNCLENIKRKEVFYGAIAYSATLGVESTALDFKSRNIAEAKAKAACKKHSQDCVITVWFKGDTCGALAVDNRNGWGSSKGITKSVAKLRALISCNNKGSYCSIRRVACNSK